MKDIELPPLPAPFMELHRDLGATVYDAWATQMQSYARAAVEAAQAQRVTDGLTLAAIGHKHFGNPIPQAWYAAAKELLASTPAPAQQEPGTPMDAHRAAYFMRRFLHDEKMLGPNEQAALQFTIAALEALESAVKHQEQPQQERRPMTEQEFEVLHCKEKGYVTTGLMDIVAMVERHHGIRKD